MAEFLGADYNVKVGFGTDIGGGRENQDDLCYRLNPTSLIH
jgi:hypothetical protein